MTIWKYIKACIRVQKEHNRITIGYTSRKEHRAEYTYSYDLDDGRMAPTILRQLADDIEDQISAMRQAREIVKGENKL